MIAVFFAVHLLDAEHPYPFRVGVEQGVAAGDDLPGHGMRNFIVAPVVVAPVVIAPVVLRHLSRRFACKVLAFVIRR